jgi:hypothetical protein
MIDRKQPEDRGRDWRVDHEVDDVERAERQRGEDDWLSDPFDVANHVRQRINQLIRQPLFWRSENKHIYG